MYDRDNPLALNFASDVECRRLGRSLEVLVRRRSKLAVLLYASSHDITLSRLSSVSSDNSSFESSQFNGVECSEGRENGADGLAGSIL